MVTPPDSSDAIGPLKLASNGRVAAPQSAIRAPLNFFDGRTSMIFTVVNPCRAVWHIGAPDSRRAPLPSRPFLDGKPHWWAHARLRSRWRFRCRG